MKVVNYFPGNEITTKLKQIIIQQIKYEDQCYFNLEILVI